MSLPSLRFLLSPLGLPPSEQVAAEVSALVPTSTGAGATALAAVRANQLWARSRGPEVLTWLSEQGFA